MRKVTLVALVLAACTLTFTASVKNNHASNKTSILANDGGAPIPLCDPYKDPNCKLPGGAQ